MREKILKVLRSRITGFTPKELWTALEPNLVWPDDFAKSEYAVLIQLEKEGAVNLTWSSNLAMTYICLNLSTPLLDKAIRDMIEDGWLDRDGDPREDL